jgi:hypothetical protein
MARVPDVVIGEPDTLKKLGTVADTLVTVPLLVTAIVMDGAFQNVRNHQDDLYDKFSGE